MDLDKLGQFYIGHPCSPTGDADPSVPLFYPSKDLTTHALCVGMTGSGKTGLCIGLLEEAAIDGVPAIAIDPKGDLANLLLTFPRLSAEEFEPWIDEAEAKQKGVTVPERAAAVAETWRKGLAASGQGPERIAKLRATVDMAVYTPGSEAGAPLSILRSLKAPPAALLDDLESLRDRVSGVVSGILALLAIDADPVRSREHILLSTLVLRAWQAGRDLDIGELIAQVMTPPMDRVGVLEVDAFFPPKSRNDLAMSLNNLLASPAFAGWMVGEPLNVQRLFWTEEGKPRLSILNIAHLGDTERMFFVTYLLNEILAWMRTQPGTGSLRALLYMDEVFGFFPPVANPPSKKPMLTLLKQGRAFGLGVVLATQNPVDLDYKGLSNCGTWFLGRLQTERDLARVLDGLQGAASAGGGTFDRKAIEARIAGLSGRTFVLNNVHGDGPVMFKTRWAMSYLRGPLTRTQIQTLAQANRKPASPNGRNALPSARMAAVVAPTGGLQATSPMAPAAEVASATAAATTRAPRPVLDPAVPQYFMPPRRQPVGDVIYLPAVAATVVLHYAHRYAELDRWLEPTLLADLAGPATNTPWDGALWCQWESLHLSDTPLPSATFAAVDERLSKKGIAKLEKLLKSHVQKNETMPVFYCRSLKLWSRYGEDRGATIARAQLVLREKRDESVKALKGKYRTRIKRLNEQIRRAEQKLTREQAQVSERHTNSAMTVAGSLWSSIAGRGRMFTAAKQVARGVSQSQKERGDVERAMADLKVRRDEFAELEAEFEADVQALEVGEQDVVVEEKQVSPRKGDYIAKQIAVVWLPWASAQGQPTQPLWGASA